MPAGTAAVSLSSLGDGRERAPSRWPASSELLGWRASRVERGTHLHRPGSGRVVMTAGCCETASNCHTYQELKSSRRRVLKICPTSKGLGCPSW